MVRNFVKKTNRGETPAAVMLAAVRSVKKDGRAIRAVARENNINYRTLARYCKRISQVEIDDVNRVKPSIPVGYYQNRKVFSPEDETELADYIVEASESYNGLTPKEIKTLAYNFCIVNSIPCPKSWTDNQCAGSNWYTDFMKRHDTLSIRKSEAASLVRAISFDHTNVDFFFNNLATVLGKYNVETHQIWNMNETGATSVQRPDRIVALRKFFKPVCDDWMLNNPGKTMTMYDISQLISRAYPLAMTPSNMRSECQCTEICPINRDTFSDVDLTPRSVSNRESSSNQPSEHLSNHLPEQPENHLPDRPQIQVSEQLENQIPEEPQPEPSSSCKSASEVRSLSKAGARKVSNRNKSGKRETGILADTSIKRKLEKQAEKVKRKRVKKSF